MLSDFHNYFTCWLYGKWCMNCVHSGWTWQWTKTASMSCQLTLTTLCQRKVSRCSLLLLLWVNSVEFLEFLWWSLLYCCLSAVSHIYMPFSRWTWLSWLFLDFCSPYVSDVCLNPNTSKLFVCSLTSLCHIYQGIIIICLRNPWKCLNIALKI